MNNLYNRVMYEVTVDGKQLDCWVYIYCDGDYASSKGARVKSGDWNDFME